MCWKRCYNRFIFTSCIIRFRNNDQHLKGTLFNFGIQEVTIPELLVSYFDRDKNLIYVDHFLERKVRKQHILIIITGFKQNKTYKSLKNCFVNGLSNESIVKDVVPNRNNSEKNNNYKSKSGKGYHQSRN
jgi:hypothetical protein